MELEELVKITARLARARARADSLSRERDQILRAARDAGAGWADLKRASGMTDRGLQVALKRTSVE